jgi:Protein of unknown function (DUF2967)
MTGAATPQKEVSGGNKSSFKFRASAENKENFRRSDMCKIQNANKNANKVENGSKKERRPFKCERLSNIFSRESPNKDKSPTKTKRINSAPVYRKNSTAQSRLNDEDPSKLATDMTMFPFDREAIDYERIQRECFAVEEEFFNENLNRTRKPFFPYDCEDDSPSYEAFDQSTVAHSDGIFQQYAMISQHERERQSKKRAQSPIETVKQPPLSKIEHNRKLNETSVLIHEQPANSNVTSPIPDLKIDFFAEPTVMASSSSFSRENEIVKCDALDECQQLNSTSSFCSKNTASNNNNVNSNINGSINLTSNPMSTAVCTTPRATIVVQQVCFSLPFSEIYKNIYSCFSHLNIKLFAITL